MSMRVICSGFNLYGQFINHNNVIIESFIDFTYDDVINFDLNQTLCVIVKNDGNVFLHGRNGDKMHETKKIEFPNNLNIVQTACSDDKILFLTNNSLIFKLDLITNDQLVPELLPSDIFSEKSIRKLVSGSRFNVALSEDGKVTLFSLSKQLHYKNKNIVDIQAGREHFIILDRAGNVYSFGRGSRGQLGNGCLDDELEPKLMEALAGIKINKIAAGGWHSCAVSTEGDLYAWGWNGNGQLGIGTVNEEAVGVMVVPHVVDFPDDLNVVDVACGNRHTVVLLDNGNLFGTGWNKYHQLGKLDSCKDNIYSMRFLYNFSNINVNSLKCGPWSTVVIAS